MKRPLITTVAILALSSAASAQEIPSNASKPLIWSALQLVPSTSWTFFPEATHFALEWEATPVLYSFGLNRLASPWKFFSMTPVARYTGSVEAVVSAQVFTSKPGGSRFGYSGQVLGHIPIIERGEYLAGTVGIARYATNGRHMTFVVAGVSTLFGMLDTNVKFSPSSGIWMTSIDLRLF